MKRFAGLYEALDRTTSTNVKVAALEAYFRAAPPQDAAWALYLLSGRKLKRLLPSRVLWELTRDVTRLPDWLLQHCYAAVGDFAEAMALLIEPAPGADEPEQGLDAWIRGRVLPLREMDVPEQRRALVRSWQALSESERLVFNKIVTAEFRVGAAATLVIRALGRAAGVDAATMAHRVMGDWEPSAEFFRGALAGAASDSDVARPYPFFLAAPLEDPVESLGDPAEWLAEWKWDGIRAQAVRRAGSVHLWSRGEELVTPRFPEVVTSVSSLPDGTVIDGEILAYRDAGVLPFHILQKRIGRVSLTPRILADAPVVLMAFDLLEAGGADIRHQPLSERRARLESLLAPAAGASVLASPRIAATSWAELARAREESRARNVEGLVLKRLASAYGAGRKRGDWWKWKIAPFTLDVVMTHAHPGHGKRASLYTDYTFAVWDQGVLVPVARAYSGLSDDEIRELDGWVRRHTLERYGPTRAVEATQVFELAFEAIARSTRHRSGIAVRFPRILRWRQDKPAAEADTLQALEAMLPKREAEAPAKPPPQRRLPFEE